MNDEEIRQLLLREGYFYLRKLPTGEWTGLKYFLFTVGLVVGLDPHGYRTRFCYNTLGAATLALLYWDGSGDPPGPWIKEKGRTLAGEPVDRANPNLTNAP